MVLLWPNGGTKVPPKPGVATSGFRCVSEYGMRYHPVYHKWMLHAGMDLIGIGDGGRVKAVAAGKVTVATYSGGYGNMVEITIQSGTYKGYRFRYGHNSKFLVKKGELVSAGQAIAIWGMTGTATGVHVHFEVLPPGKSQINPRPFMTSANAGGSGGGGTPVPPGTKGKKQMAIGVIYVNTHDQPDNTKRRGAVIDTTSGRVSEFAWFPPSYADGLAVGFGLAKAAPVTKGNYDQLVADFRAK